jgi:predicted nucleotidyltransferase
MCHVLFFFSSKILQISEKNNIFVKIFRMTIDFLRQNNLIIFEAISGSQAYGTNTPTSDTDIRGVFVLPENLYYGLYPHSYIHEVKDEKGDIKFYELNKFLEFLYENKPDCVELAHMPENCIIYKHPVWDYIDGNKFLSKKCGAAFSGFARNQIRKARGLKKAINNPQPEKRKTPLHFCKIIDGVKSQDLQRFTEEELSTAGVSNVQNGEGVYGLFLDPDNLFNFKGIINKDETSNGLRLSSIPKEWYTYYNQEPVIFVYNQNGYKVHCKDHKKYWDWVKNRNEDRYKTNIKHGKNMDSKNMLHTMRGVNMAIEIGQGEGVIVRRPDREELMRIRRGERNFDELMVEIESKLEKIQEIYKTSDLPDRLDVKYVNMIAHKMRKKFYEGK